MINAVLDGATMPYGQAPTAPNPAPALDGSNPYAAIGPHLVALGDQLAAQSGRAGARVNFLDNARINGVTFNQFKQNQDQDHIVKVASTLGQSTANMDDGQFDALYKQLQSQLATPPTPEATPELKGPSTGQLVLGGLAALLAPHFAPMALAAPFQSQLHQQQVEAQGSDARNTQNFQKWKEQIQGTQGLLGDVERRDATNEQIASRKQAADDNAAYRKQINDANNQAKAELELSKQKGKLSLATLTSDTKKTIAAGISQDKQLADAVKLIHNTSGPDRATLANSFREQGLPLFQKFSDDDIAAFATLLPKESATIETTKENQALMPGKLQAQTDKHVIAEIQKQYLGPKMAADIAQSNATTAAAWKRVHDMESGLNGRGRGSQNAWIKLGMNRADAEAKTRAEIAKLGPVRQSYVDHIREVNSQLAAPDADPKKASALISKRGQLQDALAKLDGDISGYAIVLKQNTEAQKAIAQKVAETGVAGPIGTGLPKGASVQPLSGQSSTGVKWKVIKK